MPEHALNELIMFQQLPVITSDELVNDGMTPTRHLFRNIVL
jgi:hypothetical protein